MLVMLLMLVMLVNLRKDDPIEADNNAHLVSLVTLRQLKNTSEAL